MKVTCSHSITEKVIVVIGILLILSTSLVTIDSWRLKHAKKGTKPLITISTVEYETEYQRGTKYIGLGYAINYYESTRNVKYMDSYGYLTLGGGAEFRLFDIIQMWSRDAL